MTIASTVDRTLVYAGFWRRAVAWLTDLLVLSPLVIMNLTYGHSSRAAEAISTIVTCIVGTAFEVFFLSRWGQTPGKMLVGIRVTRVDGSPIRMNQVWWRISVNQALSVAWVIGNVYAVASIPNGDWSSHSRKELQDLLRVGNPTAPITNVAGPIWFCGEIIALLANRQRRALHDFMAGTVVIRPPGRRGGATRSLATATESASRG